MREYLLIILARPRLLIAAVLVLVLIVAGFVFVPKRQQGTAPTTFFECAHMYKVSEGSPRTCTAGLFGQTFVEYTGNAPQMENEIRIVNLPPAPVLNSSPLTLSGEASSTWYASDGTLDVKLVIGTGKVIARAKIPGNKDPAIPATHGLVPFSAQIIFTPPEPNSTGAIVITKAGTTTVALVLPVWF
jgi:hypothetical protein